MKTIVFIGTLKSGSSREAIKAAERLGYYTVLFTNRSNHLKNREEFPDVHLMLYNDLTNIESITEQIRSLQLKSLNICAVISFIDPYCHMACLIAEEFGVNKFTSSSIKNMENKSTSRELLKNSDYIPKFYKIDNNNKLDKETIKEMLPVIVKSPQSTGSKDVFLIESIKQYNKCIENLDKKYKNQKILVEEFLDGPQFLVEALVINKVVKIVAFIKQDISLINKHFIITGYNLLIEPEYEFFNNLRTSAEAIIKAHGLENGPCHLELRYIKGNWKLIEINPRISGGGMNKLLKIGLGIDLVQETIKLALGEIPNVEPIYKINTYAKYITINKSGILERVTGKNKALNSIGVKSVYIKPRKGTKLTIANSMGDRYAYVIAVGNSEKEAIENANNAATNIRFHLKAEN